MRQLQSYGSAAGMNTAAEASSNTTAPVFYRGFYLTDEICWKVARKETFYKFLYNILYVQDITKSNREFWRYKMIRKRIPKNATIFKCKSCGGILIMQSLNGSPNKCNFCGYCGGKHVETIEKNDLEKLLDARKDEKRKT